MRYELIMDKQKNIFTLIFFQALALTGSTLTGFALPLLMFKGSHEISEIGLVYFFQIGPGLFASVFAGYLIDRHSRRLIFNFSLLAYLLNLTFLWAAYHFEMFGKMVVYCFTINLSVISVFQMLSFYSLVREAADKEMGVLVNVLLSLRNTVPRLIAPALACVLVQYDKVPIIIEIDFLVNCLFLVMVYKLSRGFSKTQNSNLSIKDYKEVFSLISKTRAMRTSLFSLLQTNATTSVFGVFIIPIGLHFMTEAQIGLNLLIGGIGSIVGALCFHQGFMRFNLSNILPVSHLLQGVTVIFMAVFPDHEFFWVFVFLYFFTVPIQNGYSFNLWQESTKPSVYGRLFATKGMVLQTSSMIIFFSIGFIGDWVLVPMAVTYLSPEQGYQGLCIFLSLLGVLHIVKSLKYIYFTPLEIKNLPQSDL